MGTGRAQFLLITIVCIIVAISLNLNYAFSATINVPTPGYPTIQAGIDAAADGDTVLVADGTYTGDGNKNLDFKGKAITVLSENGPNNTTIDCENEGRGFWFHTDEDENSVLSGFTITNGQADYGGGIACFNASPTITNCIVIENATNSLGGGIYCEASAPIIRNSIISKNSASSGGGGIASRNNSSPGLIDCSIIENKSFGDGFGVYSKDGSLNLDQCTIQDNYRTSSTGSGGGIYSINSNTVITDCVITGHIAGNGGGIYCNGGSLQLTDSTISENEGTNIPNYGGGISCSGADVTISGCTISQNTAGGGGGVFCDNSTINISKCIITENRSTKYRSDGYGGGGGIFCPNSTGSITNCLITKNTAAFGGGISSDGNAPKITNCTISQNSASGDSSGNNDSSGGIYIRNSSPVITNCIFWANSSGEILVTGGSPSIIYSSVQNGWPGEGNISVNPEFADPANGDYRLADYSPCIGAGTSDGAPDSDITGSPRPGPPGSDPDMGAYENNRETPDVPPLDIFGVQVGNVLTYQGTYPGGSYASESEVTLIDQTTFPTTTLVIEYSADGSIMGRSWYETTSSELTLWGEDFGDFYKFSNGLLAAWYPMQVGDQRYSSATVPIMGLVFNVSMTVNVLIKESIDLGFDTLEAYKLEYIVRAWGHGADESDITYRWAVPYLGYVKYQEGESSEVLTDFAIGGGMITPTTDFDEDGLKDYEELIIYETNLKSSDTDDDGLSDGDEVNTYGTDPNNEDSDNDGLNDGDEVNTYDTDPINEDSDNDGLTDGDEVNTYETNPNNEDTDSDGLNDGDEVNTYGTDPNDQDTDGDGLTDGEEVNTYETDPNNQDTDGDGLTDKQEVDLGRHPSNWEPDAPELYLPPNGEPGLSLTPELETADFSDNDADDHTLTQWQISTVPFPVDADPEPEDLVIDLTSETYLTVFEVPPLVLDANNTEYFWRARFTDSDNATSEWADPFSFTTVAASPEDNDPADGIPDGQEADCLAIFDPDAVPQDTACFNSVVGNAQIGMQGSTNVASIEACGSVDPVTIPEGLQGVELAMGLISFKAICNQVGDRIEIIYYSSEPLPDGVKWYKYDPINGWQDYSAHIVSISPDRKTITVEYEDGGFGDLDGVANGVIIDPSGPGAVIAAVGGGGGGGGGCLISTAANGSRMPKEPLTLVLLLGLLMMGLSALRKKFKK